MKKVKITANKSWSKLTVKTVAKAKITAVTYKNKKTASKGKKTGRINKYAVVRTNKKGRIVIKLKKKLRKHQAVRITVVKKGYKNKTVIRVRK